MLALRFPDENAHIRQCFFASFYIISESPACSAMTADHASSCSLCRGDPFEHGILLAGMSWASTAKATITI